MPLLLSACYDFQPAANHLPYIVACTAPLAVRPYRGPALGVAESGAPCRAVGTVARPGRIARLRQGEGVKRVAALTGGHRVPRREEDPVKEGGGASRPLHALAGALIYFKIGVGCRGGEKRYPGAIRAIAHIGLGR